MLRIRSFPITSFNQPSENYVSCHQPSRNYILSNYFFLDSLGFIAVCQTLVSHKKRINFFFNPKLTISYFEVGNSRTTRLVNQFKFLNIFLSNIKPFKYWQICFHNLDIGKPIKWL